MSKLKKFISLKGYTFIFLDTSEWVSFFFFLHVRDKMHNDKIRQVRTLVFYTTVVNPVYTIDKNAY